MTTSRHISSWGALSYDRCRGILAGRPGCRLGPNTTLVRLAGHYAVVLYSTTILEFWADGTVKVFTGGERTTTTRGRINALAPRYVRQINFEWFVGSVPFAEGMELDAPGLRGRLLDDWFAGDEVAGMALHDLAEEAGVEGGA